VWELEGRLLLLRLWLLLLSVVKWLVETEGVQLVFVLMVLVFGLLVALVMVFVLVLGVVGTVVGMGLEQLVLLNGVMVLMLVTGLR
jgi:hypothetical protein